MVARSRWPARLALIGYAVLLSAALLTPVGWGGASGAGLFDLRSGARIGRVVIALALHALVEVVRFVPVGALATLSLPAAIERRTRKWPAAAAASLVITIAVLTLEFGRPWQWVGPLDCALPFLGCLLGIVVGHAAQAGPNGLRRVLVAVAATLVAVPALFGAALLAAAEREPLIRDRRAVTSEEKRRLYSLLSRENPNRLKSGQTRTIALASADIDLLLAWGMSVVLGERAKARVDLSPSDEATIAVTLGIPGSSRYLNVVTGARVRVEDGRLHVGEPHLRVGHLALPGFARHALAPVLTAVVQADRRARPILAGVQRLEIADGRITVTYGHMELPPRLMASFIWGEGSDEEMRAAVRAYVERLLEAAPRLPAGEARFGATFEVAFAWARARSAESSPAQENRAALLALGILMGHRRLEQFFGPVVGDDSRRAAPFTRVTLRGRDDWTKHFAVSAALTVLSAEAPSDAVGLFKEELDASRGSGFSFGDLMADRAGTTFALLATRDDASARALQDRIGAGFRVDDYFPPAADLPENIRDAELTSRYGGVGGPLFRTWAAEVERRLWSCPAYRGLAPAR